MNKLSGRLPVASTRRLSASISGSQRPHSSYSLNATTTNSQSNNPDNENQHHSIPSTVHQNQNEQARTSFCTFDHTVTPTLSSVPNNLGTVSSLLMRKQQDTTSTQESTSSGSDCSSNSSGLVYRHNQKVNLSYTDQLKSMLLQQQQQHQISNGFSRASEELNWCPSVLAPISVSTQLMSKSMTMNEPQQQKMMLSGASSYDMLREKSYYYNTCIFFFIKKIIRQIYSFIFVLKKRLT